MKKILSIVAIIVSPLILSAQESGGHQIDREIFRTCSIIFMVALFMLFFITIINKIIEYRLKNKIVEKGIPESIITSILKTNPNEDRNSYVKWGTILAGIGVGLTLINYTLPLGFHSLAIMAFSIAISFIGYYLLIRYLDK
jgi:hypothetical protein